MLKTGKNHQESLLSPSFIGKWKVHQRQHKQFNVKMCCFSTIFVRSGSDVVFQSLAPGTILSFQAQDKE